MNSTDFDMPVLNTDNLKSDDMKHVQNMLETHCVQQLLQCNICTLRQTNILIEHVEKFQYSFYSTGVSLLKSHLLFYMIQDLFYFPVIIIVPLNLTFFHHCMEKKKDLLYFKNTGTQT